MEIAVNASGKMIKAGPNAPPKAICPHCKGVVILRMRRRSKQPGDVTYFWRHESHANPRCPERFRYDKAN